MSSPDKKTSALLVIDVQNGNTSEAWQRDAVIGTIRTLIDRAKAADVPVIWVQHEAGPFKPGSDAWQIVEAVRPPEGETVIGKQYLDAFVETPLRKALDERGVGHVVICGAATDACIRATTARAQIEGYDTTLVSDGHTSDEGPWPLPLPDGREVPIGGEQMVAYTNFFVADTEYPGITTEVVPAAEVAF
ncbi:isochorismatase family protein [Luteipulveratus sp. YIM 133132]|uniref:isochorismatase family protein n=1 Tax=Luteipulveratus flavus TaxID=3031728 RepID=UPI0023B19579|nr:isochorismatase family protein [Luteipulveratus sp. YIM 133132]MDE9366714.1 isochorismatase family protein [Luteipulveratus sp. YIM 133132]